MIGVNIQGDNNNIRAKVTRNGQLVVAPLSTSEPVAIKLDVVDTAFNFITPVHGQSIIITDIIASADKNVSNTTPADVEIYEADEADLTDVFKSIVRPQLIRATNLALTGLNLLVPEGKWVNAKTTDIGILVTIMFYRVPQEFV